MKGVTIDRPGPINLLETTTSVSVDHDLETRPLSVPVNDSSEQTQRILHAQGEMAAGAELPTVDLAPWHAMYDWIRHVEHRVVMPWGTALADYIAPTMVRLRRDFLAILSLIHTHAVLHQESRERDADGRIIATEDDYLAVHELVAELLAETVNVKVKASVRQTVNKVIELCGHQVRSAYGPEPSVTIAQIAQALGRDTSVASRHVADAILSGYLKNDDTRPGHEAKIRPSGIQLPPIDGHVLPPNLSVLQRPRREPIPRREAVR
jgi:hypothetical protein